MPTTITGHITFPKPVLYQECSEFDKERYFKREGCRMKLDESYYTTKPGYQGWNFVRFDTLVGCASQVHHVAVCPFCLHISMKDGRVLECDICHLRIVEESKEHHIIDTMSLTVAGYVTFDLLTGKYSNVKNLDDFDSVARQAMKI